MPQYFGKESGAHTHRLTKIKKALESQHMMMTQPQHAGRLDRPLRTQLAPGWHASQASEVSSGLRVVISNSESQKQAPAGSTRGYIIDTHPPPLHACVRLGLLHLQHKVCNRATGVSIAQRWFAKPSATARSKATPRSYAAKTPPSFGLSFVRLQPPHTTSKVVIEHPPPGGTGRLARRGPPRIPTSGPSGSSSSA